VTRLREEAENVNERGKKERNVFFFGKDL